MKHILRNQTSAPVDVVVTRNYEPETVTIKPDGEVTVPIRPDEPLTIEYAAALEHEVTR